MVQISQESRHKYRATQLSVGVSASTTHPFIFSALLPLLTHSTVLIHLLVRSLTPGGKRNEESQKEADLDPSAVEE